MHFKIVLVLLIVTALGISIASAVDLGVDGGSLQVFEYTAEVPVEAKKHTDNMLRTIWDGSQLQVVSQGFDCQDGTAVFVDVSNAGAAMQGPSTWELLLDQTVAAHGELPELNGQEQVRLQVLVSKPGVYIFKVLQREGFSGPAEIFSSGISTGLELCAESTMQPPTSSPTALALLTQTGTPEIVPTEVITPPETSTVEPTVEPTVESTVAPTVEPTVEFIVEPTAEPTVEPTAEPTAVTTPIENQPEPPPTGEPEIEQTPESTPAS
jgi:YqxM protein